LRLFGFSVGGGGGAEFDEEARARGKVLLHSDGALVLLQYLGGDREAEAGAAAFGGEVGQEETLAHLVGDAGAGVGDGELDHTGGEQTRGEGQFAEQRVLHGLGGVVDQVGERAFERFWVGQDEREIGGEVAADADAAQPAGEERERVFDDGVGRPASA